MKRFPLYRIIAISGLFFHCLHYHYAVSSMMPDMEGQEGWFAFLTALLCLVPMFALYLTEAVTENIVAYGRRSLIKLYFPLVGIPLALTCPGYGVVLSSVWYTYSAVLFVFEIVSLFLRQKPKICYRKK